MKQVAVISLGCSKNLVDAEMMMGLLQKAQWQLTEDRAQADVIVVNTCTFIEAAKEESVQEILQAAQYKETGRARLLVVTGCLSQQFREELFREIPEIDILLGTESWERIVEAVERFEREGKSHVAYFDRAPLPDLAALPRERTTPHYSAYVKVAEGCSNGCAFCLIPYVRGRFRSRSVASIVSEVRKMAQEGVREINVIAQDTTSYGRDLENPTTLAALLRELTAIEGIEWVRLLYLYPKYFTDELLQEIVTNPKICKYIDIPLQHISDRILQRMNRRDRKADIISLLEKVRAQAVPITLRTTFIVGFPGETEADFKELCELVKKIRFDRVGVFPYSQENGTPAARMPEQVPDEIKRQRYDILMSMQAAISEQLNRESVGQETVALIETAATAGTPAEGRLISQAPDVDGKVYLENEPDLLPGDFVPVKIMAGYAYDVVAESIGPAY